MITLNAWFLAIGILILMSAAYYCGWQEGYIQKKIEDAEKKDVDDLQ